MQVASWRLVFFINLPLAIAVVVIAVRHVPESRDPTASAHIDVAGAALGAVGLGALTYGLITWQDQGFTAPAVLLALLVGLVALIGFVVRERTVSDPMLPLGIFALPLFRAVNVVTFVVYAALGGVFFWLVLNLQVVAGYSPLAAGLALLPTTLIMLLLSSRMGALAQRVGARLPMAVGPLLCALGVAGMTRIGQGASYIGDVLPPVIVFALGLSVTVAPLTATALAAAPVQHAGLASGVNNAVARVAGLLAVAALPLVAGLSGEAYHDPNLLEPAYRTAMWFCTSLLTAGGVLAAVLVRHPRSDHPLHRRLSSSVGTVQSTAHRCRAAHGNGRWPSTDRRHETFDEVEGNVGDLAPAALDGQGVPAALDLDDLGDAFVVLLLLVGGVRNGPGAPCCPSHRKRSAAGHDHFGQARDSPHCK